MLVKESSDLTLQLSSSQGGDYTVHVVVGENSEEIAPKSRPGNDDLPSTSLCCRTLRLHESIIVALGAPRVGHGERCKRVVHDVVFSHISRQHCRICRDAHAFFDKEYHIAVSRLQRFAWFRRKQELHFVHHRHANCNFAVIHFFWDRILGTYRRPDAGQTLPVTTAFISRSPPNTAR